MVDVLKLNNITVKYHMRCKFYTINQNKSGKILFKIEVNEIDYYKKENNNIYLSKYQ